MEATKLFEGVSRADVYAKYRPTWPAKVYERIMSFLSTRRSQPYKLAVDVGCGSGQSTFSLAPWFERVIGFDISEAQIGVAIKANSVKHVEFKVSAAEKLPLEDDSVDLLTCGLAAHWLEFDAFCCEVQRVLKPRGCLAIYGHGEPWLDHPDPDVKQKLTIASKEFDVDSIGPFWHEKKQIACNLYRDFSLPFEDSIREDNTEFRINMTLTHYLGFVRSWSACQIALEKDPSNQSFLDDYQRKILAAYGKPEASTDDVVLDVVFPLAILLGSKADSKQ